MMALTNYQLDIIKALADNNHKKAKQYALVALSKDTTQKNKYWVEKLTKKLNMTSTFMELPSRVESFLNVEFPAENFKFPRYYVSKQTSLITDKIVKMYHASEKLEELNIRYCNSILLTGQSGVGKTEYGRYLSYVLNKPLIYMNFSQVLDSHMGNTQKNLSEIFNSVRSLDCVFFIDEIDSIASKRETGQSSADAEIGRATIVLMNELDRVENHCIVLAATNIPESLDEALLRRFNIKYEMELLTEDAREDLVRSFLEDVGMEYKYEGAVQIAKEITITSNLISRITESIADAVLNDSVVFEQGDNK